MKKWQGSKNQENNQCFRSNLASRKGLKENYSGRRNLKNTFNTSKKLTSKKKRNPLTICTTESCVTDSSRNSTIFKLILSMRDIKLQRTNTIKWPPTKHFKAHNKWQTDFPSTNRKNSNAAQRLKYWRREWWILKPKLTKMNNCIKNYP